MSESSFSYSSNESENILSDFSGDENNEIIDNEISDDEIGDIHNLNNDSLINHNPLNFSYESYQQNYNSNYIQTPEFIDINVKCLPLIFYHHYDDIKYLENSSKLILPKRILFEISKYEDISYPLKFKINDTNTLFSVHECGEDIDEMLISNNYIANLNLEPYKECKLTLITSPIDSGKKIILKPHSSKFLDIQNPKEFLEKSLNQLYTYLTKGQTILIPNDDIQLYIDVINCEPNDSICILDTDLEVDFEEPYDYKEYIENKKKELERKKKEELEKQKEIENNKPFKLGRFNFNHNYKKDKDDDDSFVPFSGKGHRLGTK